MRRLFKGNTYFLLLTCFFEGVAQILIDTDQVNVHRKALPAGRFHIFISSISWFFLVTGSSIIMGQQCKVITKPNLSSQQITILLFYNATNVRTTTDKTWRRQAWKSCPYQFFLRIRKPKSMMFRKHNRDTGNNTFEGDINCMEKIQPNLFFKKNNHQKCHEYVLNLRSIAY